MYAPDGFASDFSRLVSKSSAVPTGTAVLFSAGPWAYFQPAVLIPYLSEPGDE